MNLRKVTDGEGRVRWFREEDIMLNRRPYRDLPQETVPDLCGLGTGYGDICTEPVGHSEHICWSRGCDKPATSLCSHTGMLVCGYPQCDDHPHHPGG